MKLSEYQGTVDLRLGRNIRLYNMLRVVCIYEDKCEQISYSIYMFAQIIDFHVSILYIYIFI